MILISHRGNINGEQPGMENMPEYIEDTLKKGYDVEVDVWYKNGFYLGHDNPTYGIDVTFLQRPEIWCHAKNLEALTEMKKYSNIHYFWHQNDDVTLTSREFMWVMPGKQPLCDSIAVLPELNNEDVSQSIGVCSDYIEKYKKRNGKK